MNQILALREKRAKLWDAAKAFLDTKRGTDGMISAEDNATYEKMEADVVSLGREIDRLERQAVIDRELNAPTSKPLVGAPLSDTGTVKSGKATDEYRGGSEWCPASQLSRRAATCSHRSRFSAS